LSPDTFRHIIANQEKIEQERILRKKILGNVGKFLHKKITETAKPEEDNGVQKHQDMTSHLVNLNELEKMNLPKEALAKISSSIHNYIK